MNISQIAAELCRLPGQFIGALRIVFAGPPPQPEDWRERGWDSGRGQRYGEWFFSLPRIAYQSVTEYPLLLLLVIGLLGMVAGWFGTGSFGIPLLFIEKGRSWHALLTGVGTGLALFDLCMVGLLLFSRDWLLLWAARDLVKTNAVLDRDGGMNRYLSRSLLVVLLALAATVAVRNWGKPADPGWPERIAFLTGACLSTLGAWRFVALLLRHGGTQADRAIIVKWFKKSRILHGRDEKARPELLQLHVIATFTVAGISLICVIGFFWPDFFERISTALMLCLFLTLVGNAYGFVKFHGLGSPFVIWPILVIAAGFAFCFLKSRSGPVYSHRYPDLAAVYASPVKLTGDETEAALPASDQGLPSDVTIAAWAARQREAQRAGSSAEKPKLVIVCTSGGGILAASWTVAVLAHLEANLPGFLGRVRLITGASGGMCGAAVAVGRAADQIAPDEAGFQQAAADSLNPSVRWMTLRDLPQVALRPLFTLAGQNLDDRGTAIELAWKENAPALGKTFSDIRPLEEAGRIPSLIFSPMVVEDGRQLLITNLDLRNMERLDLDQSTTQPDTRPVVSLRALIGKEGGKLSLAAAARMNATFPFVSPAGELPTNPPLRVVDAGYSENYGVRVACLWLMQNIEALTRHTSGVMVIQLRAGETSTAAQTLDDEKLSSRWKALSGFTSPPQGLLGSRSGGNVYGNDLLLYTASMLSRRSGLEIDVIGALEYKGSASLSWHLTPAEKEDIWNEASKAIGGAKGRLAEPAAPQEAPPPVPEAEAPHEQVQQVLTERNVQRAERLLFQLKSPQERSTLPAKKRLEK